MRRFQQKICTLRGTGQCPICPECKSPSDYVADDNCVSCWTCEHDLGIVRGGQTMNKVLSEQSHDALAVGRITNHSLEWAKPKYL